MMLRTYAGADALRSGAPREPICRWDDSPCPLCDSTQADVVSEACDGRRPDGPIFAVVRCRRCHLTFTNPRPDAATMGRFRDAASNIAPAKTQLTRLLQAWLRRVSDLPFPLPALGAARVLDCAPDDAEPLQPTVGGPWSVTVNTRTGADDDWPEESRFDLMTVRGTLERQHQPRAWLQRAYRSLVPGGLLCIRCPHADRSRTLDLPRRLTHFTPATLQSMLTTVGLRTLTVQDHRRSRTFTLTAARGE